MRERSTRKVVEYKSQRLTYNKPGAVFTAKPEVAVPTSGELSARRTIQLQHAIGNQAVQRMIAAKKQGGNTIQRFTDEDVKRRAYEIWVERGRPQNQSQEQQLGDMDQARHELRQIEQGAAKISSGDKTRDWHQAGQLHGVEGLISRWAPNLDSDNFGEVIRSTPQAELIALRTDTSFLDQMEVHV